MKNDPFPRYRFKGRTLRWKVAAPLSTSPASPFFPLPLHVLLPAPRASMLLFNKAQHSRVWRDRRPERAGGDRCALHVQNAALPTPVLRTSPISTVAIFYSVQYCVVRSPAYLKQDGDPRRFGRVRPRCPVAGAERTKASETHGIFVSARSLQVAKLLSRFSILVKLVIILIVAGALLGTLLLVSVLQFYSLHLRFGEERLRLQSTISNIQIMQKVVQAAHNL